MTIFGKHNFPVKDKLIRKPPSSLSMRNTKGLAPVLTILLTLTSQPRLAAQSPALQPLPACEHMVYRQTIGDKTSIRTQDWRFHGEAAVSYYEVKDITQNSINTIRLDSAKLSPFFVESTTTGTAMTIRHRSEIVKGYISGNDSLYIFDFSQLSIILRGFPWGSKKSMPITAIEATTDGSGFASSFAVQGRETIIIDGKSYDCWRGQIAVDGIIGSLMPKMKFWFLAEYPHYLVKYEGAMVGAGASKRILEELTEYSSACPGSR